MLSIFSCVCWSSTCLLQKNICSSPLFIFYLGCLFFWCCGSAGKTSACNAGNPGSIPGSGRFPEESTGFPLQYSWASLVSQIVKNLPGMWNTWVWSLGWEDPLEEGMITHSSILAWRIPRYRGAWQATVPRRCKESDTTEWPSTAQHRYLKWDCWVIGK